MVSIKSVLHKVFSCLYIPAGRTTGPTQRHGAQGAAQTAGSSQTHATHGAIPLTNLPATTQAAPRPTRPQGIGGQTGSQQRSPAPQVTQQQQQQQQPQPQPQPPVNTAPVNQPPVQPPQLPPTNQAQNLNQPPQTQPPQIQPPQNHPPQNHPPQPSNQSPNPPPIPVPGALPVVAPLHAAAPVTVPAPAPAPAPNPPPRPPAASPTWRTRRGRPKRRDTLAHEFALHNTNVDPWAVNDYLNQILGGRENWQFWSGLDRMTLRTNRELTDAEKDDIMELAGPMRL